MQKRLLFWAITILVLIVVAEGIAFTALSLDITAIRNRVYDPPEVSRSDFETYLENRHPELGWPGKNSPAVNLTAGGARQSPANEKLADSPVCLSLYGDSFTYGTEVGDSKAWSNLLAESLRCRVNNYGVPGYGSDQAVMRFIGMAEDDSPVTILGIYPLNLERNLTQWQLLIAGPHAVFGFKPVFADRSGRAERVALPDLTYDDFQRLAQDPSLYLKEEYYLPGERGGVYAEFPYSVALFRLVGKIFDEIRFDQIGKYPKSPRHWIRGRWYEADGKPNPHALARNELVVRQFIEECGRRKSRCIVLIIPDWESLETYVVEGVSEPLGWITRPFEDEIEVWDATSYIGSMIDDRLGVCHYVGVRRDCNGHFNAEGYQLLADFVLQKLAAAE